MNQNPAIFINIILAIVALYLYYKGSLHFYLNKPTYLRYLLLAIGIDALTAILGSFKITPTTVIHGSDFVPWGSVLFISHMILASVGFFGFIIMIIYIFIKGKNLIYSRLRPFQFKVLLPIWITGETIALTNSLIKIFFGFRLYDHI